MSNKDKSNKIIFYGALFGAKIAAKLLKLRGQCAATSFPGLLASKLDKNFLSGTSFYCKSEIVTVTGTNGKTTTSGLFAAILNADNRYVLHNQKGANMPQGISTALALGINPFKKADNFVLENDEAYLSKIYDELKADYLIITNLFRDQLDRYGELETTARKIKEAIDKNPDLKILLNADDPMLHSLYTENTVTYGFENIELVDGIKSSNSPKETLYCKCGSPMHYDKCFYAHIGHYHCDCDYKRLPPKFSAEAKVYNQKTLMTVKYEDKSHEFIVHVPGLYNAYNALAAISMALTFKIKPRVIQKALNEYQSAFGRAERLTIHGKPAFIQLIKNPVGASEVIRTIRDDKNSNLLIIINDEYADGRDMSWLWDADFDALSGYNGKIIVAGKRAYDMALRLKYTEYDIKKLEVIPDTVSAVKAALNSVEEGQTLNILPTYTALLSMQNFLKKL